MSHWDDVRRHAQRAHREAASETPGQISASDLLAAAARLTGVPCKMVPAGSPLLDGSEAMFDATFGAHGVIWINREIAPTLAAYYSAHEYAHVWLGHSHAACSESDLILGPEHDEPTAAQRVAGYSLHERREREANLFAREFLLPAPALRRWFDDDRLGAGAIAVRVGVPENLVFHQLAYALLTPDSLVDAADMKATSDGPTPPSDLDHSQERAAHVAHGPLLLEAGPGTGKTRTLVARVLYLLEHGTDPTAILALTFSNKAAEEMRVRVAQVAPEATPHIWMGTFHAFGLELLRKYGDRIGLPPQPEVIDQIDALLILEGALPELPLNHYQNLYEPTTHLRAILAEISRAKDALIGPTEYAHYAEQARVSAMTGKEIEAAEKTLEVAAVYRVYQERLESRRLLDFGDLIMRAVLLLRDHDEVRARVQQSYSEILIDEYQDVNHASTLLLQQLAGDGRGLWVVGDARQAIYRFRGAAPVNMQRFAEHFPGAAVLTLRRNYRSRRSIVSAVATLAARMHATADQPCEPWEVERGEGGRIGMEVAPHADEEGAALAAIIARERAEGIPYRDQAVLCRSHGTLARIAAGLGACGIPTLYLGDLFERPEIRDLLSLVALTCEGSGQALVRVAGLPDYEIPLADVRRLLALARERNLPFPQALALAPAAEGVSARGTRGAHLLARHLDGLIYGQTVWSLLARYLFDRSEYLRRLRADSSAAGQQRRLAIYQFLQFTYTQRGISLDTNNPRRAFLAYVRRLEMFSEERELRQVPEWAAGIDAVRLLTVHASKGLEFATVYVPSLATGYFPASRRGEQCVPPPGAPMPQPEDGRQEEEECLFFVALSRARDALYLSRAQVYGSQRRKASELLALLGECLPTPVVEEGVRAEDDGGAAPVPLPPLMAPTYKAAQLDLYIDCPRRFYYEYELGLSGRRDESAYLQFHRCVALTWHWIRAEQDGGQEVAEEAALAELSRIWALYGPCDHAYEALYRHSAEDMVRRALGRAPRFGRRAQRQAWEVRLPHGRVTVEPDAVEVQERDGILSVTVQRLRTGHVSDDERLKNIYALYQVALQQEYPQAEQSMSIVYLASDDEQPVHLDEKLVERRLRKYDDAIVGILRGRFPAKPSDRECPRCAHYFICPAGDHTEPDQ